jgi:hypothetical protein
MFKLIERSDLGKVFSRLYKIEVATWVSFKIFVSLTDHV